MIWSDTDIRRYLAQKDIAIEPFDERSIQPASVDVKLGNVFYRFKKPGFLRTLVLDPRRLVAGFMECLIEERWIDLPPQGFLLGVTAEKLTLGPSVAARVEGKSSLGRLGLAIHATAGFIDPGFSGFITLEMSNQSPYPIRLFAGMWIAQIAFHPTESACTVPYGKQRGSRYADQDRAVPVISRVHKGVS